MIVLNSSGSVESLVDSVFSRMSPVEVPVDILTMNLGMNLVKKSGLEFDNTTRLQLMSGEVLLPSLDDLRINRSLVINSVVSIKHLTYRNCDF